MTKSMDKLLLLSLLFNIWNRTKQLVGNKAKGRILKRVFHEKKASQIFRKTIISYPLIRTRKYVCVSGGKKWSFFGKFDVLCFLETPVLKFAPKTLHLYNLRHDSIVNSSKLAIIWETHDLTHCCPTLTSHKFSIQMIFRFITVRITEF